MDGDLRSRGNYTDVFDVLVKEKELEKLFYLKAQLYAKAEMEKRTVKKTQKPVKTASFTRKLAAMASSFL